VGDRSGAPRDRYAEKEARRLIGYAEGVISRMIAGGIVLLSEMSEEGAVEACT